MNNSYYFSKLDDHHLTVFLFHGVIEMEENKVRNYSRKHILAKEFRDLLIKLKSSGTAVSIDQVTDCTLKGEPLPARPFVISFDDGFENNVTVAAPILEELEIPAVFYLTTHFLENNSMSWIDEVEYAIESTSHGTLQFPWFDGPMEFLDTQTKIQTLQLLREQVKPNPNIVLDELVDEIYFQCNMFRPKQLSGPLDQKMNWQQAEQLHNHPLFVVGGHTHTHCNMASLEPNELEHEITHCLRLLKEKSNINTRHFSYPEGMEYCFSNLVIDKLKSHGIVCCPTAIDGINPFGTDLFHLRRVNVT